MPIIYIESKGMSKQKTSKKQRIGLDKTETTCYNTVMKSKTKNLKSNKQTTTLEVEQVNNDTSSLRALTMAI